MVTRSPMPHRSMRSWCCHAPTRSVLPGRTRWCRPDRSPIGMRAIPGFASWRRGSCRSPGCSPRPGRRCARRNSTGSRRSPGWMRPDRDRLLGSVERFRDPERSPLGEEIREELLGRFGLFGLRLAVGLIAKRDAHHGRRRSPNALLEHSGIRPLQRLLAERYAARAQVLKARSALVALRAIGTALARDGVTGGSDVVLAVDRLEASSTELALLRLQHLVLAGHLLLDEDERAEIDRGDRHGRRCAAGRAPAGCRRRRRARRRRGRHRALADTCRQPVERSTDHRGRRNREPRVRVGARRSGWACLSPGPGALLELLDPRRVGRRELRYPRRVDCRAALRDPRRVDCQSTELGRRRAERPSRRSSADIAAWQSTKQARSTVAHWPGTASAAICCVAVDRWRRTSGARPLEPFLLRDSRHVAPNG